MIDWVSLLKEAAIALENLVSADPDMPTYGADVEEGERVLLLIQDALAKIGGDA